MNIQLSKQARECVEKYQLDADEVVMLLLLDACVTIGVEEKNGITHKLFYSTKRKDRMVAVQAKNGLVITILPPGVRRFEVRSKTAKECLERWKEFHTIRAMLPRIPLEELKEELVIRDVKFSFWMRPHAQPDSKPEHINTINHRMNIRQRGNPRYWLNKKRILWQLKSKLLRLGHRDPKLLHLTYYCDGETQEYHLPSELLTFTE